MNKRLAILCIILVSSCAQEIPDSGKAPDQSITSIGHSSPSDPSDTVSISEFMKKDTFSKEDALYIAWNDHPDMKRARFLIGSAYGKKTQAGLWPNPSMSINYKDETDMKQAVGITLSQKFELGGKQGARITNAEASAFLAQSELAEKWIIIKSRIKETFVRLAYVQEMCALQQSLVSIDNERSELLKELFKGGKLSEGISLKAEEQTEISRTLLKEFKSTADDAEKQVCIAIGLPPEYKSAEYKYSFETVSPLAEDFNTLLDMAKKNNPMLKTARMRTMVKQAEYELAQTEKWPDITVGVGMMRIMPETGDDLNEMQVGISFGLPLWNRSQGTISSAQDRINASIEKEAVSVLEIGSILSKIYNTRKRLIDEDTVYTEKIIPSAKKRIKLAEDAFKNGKISRLEVLKEMRDLNLLERNLYRIKLMLAITTIQLEKIVPPQSSPSKGEEIKQ
ncbi:TolC family protein [Planctomycetota bacterium]